METIKKMDMEQFVESIKEKLEQQGRFEVEQKHVLKNNGVMRCGLMLRCGENNVASTIYMEPFFKAYRDSVDMDEIIGEILEVCESAPGEDVDMSFFRDFSKVEDRLCMKLVNKEANLELLSKVPYRNFLDMAVVYYVDYYDSGVGSVAIQVYNSHIETWGVTEEDLWEAANINTPKRKPGRIESMGDMLAEMFADQEDGDSECCCIGESPVPMLVITNKQRVFGAAVVLYGGMLKRAADKVGSDLFILPSSLHEVLAVPMIEERDATKLKAMVEEMNQKELLPEDVLSDNVFIYRRELDRLEIA